MTDHEQSTRTPDQAQQPLTPEQLRDQDGAANLVDIVRTVYSHAGNDAQRESVFNPDGFDGTADLLGIVADIRANDGEMLDDGQQNFVDYMALQARTLDLESRIDFDELTKSPRMDMGDDAARLNLEKIARSIARKSSKETDEAEKAHLLEQRQSIFDYRKLIGAEETIHAGSGSTGHDFMVQYNAILAANADTPEAIPALLEQAAQEMNERSAIFGIQAQAYEAIIEHGYKYHATAPTNNVPMDSRLDYVATTSETDSSGNRPGATTATPTPPPVTPNPPAGTPPTPPPAAGGNGGAGTPPPANPPAGGNPNGGNNGPTNLGRLDDDTLGEMLKDSRKELAKNKSRFIRNSKIGRAVLGFVNDLGFDSVKTGEDFDEHEDWYNDIVIEHAKRKNEDSLADASLSNQAKHFKFASTLHAEREELNKDINHEMQDRKALKVGRWMGKHKIITVGGMAILAPLTGGASMVAGMSLGLGMIAGAKMDDKFRGLRHTDESLTRTDLMKTSTEALRAELTAIAADPANANISDAERQRLALEAVEDSFKTMQERSIEDLNSNIKREMWKRAGAIGAMSAVAIGGTNLLPNPYGADQWIYGHQPFTRWSLFTAGLIDLSIKRKDPNAGGHH